MSYLVRQTADAERDIRRLPGHVRQRVRRLIASLADAPIPASARELRDRPGRYRVRVDGWRIICRVYPVDQAVLILRVRRKTGPETYEALE